MSSKISFFCFTFLILAFNVFGQKDTCKGKDNKPYPPLIITKHPPKGMIPRYYIDGNRAGEDALNRLDPKEIQSIDIQKGDSIYGNVMISLKEDFDYNYITLDALRKKYVKTDDRSFVYLIDDKFIFSDQSEYFIDEKNIYSIEVYKSKDFPHLKNNRIPFTIVNILVNNNRNNISSGITIKKPVIYLYSPQELNVNFKLQVNGKLTVSYPKYPVNGWDVVIKENGKLLDKKTNRLFDYLYWEADIKNDFSKLDHGYVVHKDSTIIFLENKLSQFGFNDSESNDFITYWLPYLNQNEYNFIHFLINEECNDIAQFDITPKPDNIIRLYMVYKECDKTLKVKNQILRKNLRNGFTVVEWGGTEIK